MKVMTAKGWWALERVPLGGESCYSVACARLTARLGLTSGDLDKGNTLRSRQQWGRWKQWRVG